MSRAWYMDDSTEDQRLEHHQNPPKFVALEDLKSITGVLTFKVSLFKELDYNLVSEVSSYVHVLICLISFYYQLKLNPETLHSDGKLEQLKKDRGYTYEDRIEIAKVREREKKIIVFFHPLKITS